MKKIVSIPLILFFILILVSCSKEETTSNQVDLRNSVVGTYNCNTKTYIIDIENRLILNDSSNIDLNLSKGSALSEIQINDINGKTFVKGSNFSEITTASKGYKFDINRQEIDGVSYIGYNFFTIDGKGYHGNCSKDGKQIAFAFNFNLNDVNFVLTAIGTKK